MEGQALLKILAAVLETMLVVFGPQFVRDQTMKKIDEWEAGRLTSDAGFRAKFGEDP